MSGRIIELEPNDDGTWRVEAHPPLNLDPAFAAYGTLAEARLNARRLGAAVGAKVVEWELDPFDAEVIDLMPLIEKRRRSVDRRASEAVLTLRQRLSEIMDGVTPKGAA
ncbi:hypothetical protein SPAN111604_05405 [Sphingomonas antarctica]|uniref:hypothetical protein n=1 Tax=Sphingomonas antarctica TaxID=2040274 RepID=UPI0039E8AE72